MADISRRAVACGVIGWRAHSVPLLIIAAMAVPGYMTSYFDSLDARDVFNPFRALQRFFERGRAYGHARLIVPATLALSIRTLLALGSGLLFTKAWFGQAAGFCFATASTPRFDRNG